MTNGQTGVMPDNVGNVSLFRHGKVQVSGRKQGFDLVVPMVDIRHLVPLVPVPSTWQREICGGERGGGATERGQVVAGKMIAGFPAWHSIALTVSARSKSSASSIIIYLGDVGAAIIAGECDLPTFVDMKTSWMGRGPID